MTTDPFPLTPPTAEESARVASDAALLSAASDRLERLVADLDDVATPWKVEDLTEHGSPGVLWVSTDIDYRKPDGSGISATIVEFDNHYRQRKIAPYVAAMGPLVGQALVVWLRSAARDAAEVGPDGFAVAVARKIMGEGESA